MIRGRKEIWREQIAAELAQGCPLTSVKNFHKTFITRGVISESEFLELQINYMTGWDGNNPATENVIRRVSRV